MVCMVDTVEAQHVEISVIVPVYNAEKYIDRCVSSLLAQQTTWPFELLLIDDGSKDKGWEVLLGWARRDSRIRIFSQANKGPSAARNYGLREANGNYIIFVDSDDWVDPYYIESLRNGIETDSPGLVIGGFSREKPDEVIDDVELPQIYYQEEFHKMIKDRELYRKGFPFGKIYETGAIRRYGLTFNEGIHYGEDLIFLFSYLVHAEYIRFIDRCGYYYNQTNQENTLVLRYNSYESELAGYRLLKEAIAQLKVAYHISEEEIRPTTDRLAYFALRAIKVMYRPGEHHLKYEMRQHHLRHDLVHDDICLLESYSTRCQGIDKMICICLGKRKMIFLDCLLSLFFSCRYSWLGMIYTKYMRE